MASFATEEPVTPGQPYFWSKPTSEPKPDLSGEIKGKAIGTALNEGASAIREGTQGITAAYEKGIQNSIYAAVDPVRDDYMAKLHTADEALQGHDTPDPLGRDAPRDIKGLPRQLNTLDSARANGKLSQTDYDARLTALAKEIRAKYPGFRSYVDNEFKKITGRDSANQYIRSVIQDIDSFIAGKQAKRDQLETHLLTNGLKYEGFGPVYQAYKKDPEVNGPYALKWLNERMAADHATQEWAAESRAKRDNLQVTKEVEDKAFQQYASSSSKHWWNAAGHGLALSIDLGHPKWNEDARAIERGEKIPEMGDEEAAAIGSWRQQQGEAAMAARTKQIRDALNTKSSGGPSQSQMDEPARSSITDKQIHDQVETERKMYWDPLTDPLIKGDYAAAKRHFEMNKGRAQDDLNSLMTDKQYGFTVQRFETIRKADPNLYLNITSQFPKIESYITPLVAKSMIDATTPPSLGGVPFSQIQQEAMHKNVSPSFHGAMVDMIPLIGKTGKNALTEESTEALINNVFGDPKGSQYLQAFADKVPGGRQFVFDQMYSDANIKKVEKMAKDKPELYKKLEASADANARVMMPREYTQALPEDITDPKYSEYTPTIHYNDQTFQFTLTPGSGGFMDKEFQREFDRTSENVRRLAVIEEHSGSRKDPTVRLLEHLITYDAEPGSVIYKMMGAIAATHKQQSGQ